MEKSKVREPAVAGQFYPSSESALRNQIETLIEKNADKQDCVACILPHAGYMYSGKVAASTVSRLNIKDKVILLGPNHTGFGTAFSVMSEGLWRTPLGQVKIDSDFAKKILEHSKYLEHDILAHMYEHCLEVELPFLQYVKTDFEIVPIVVASDDIAVLKEVGREIADTIKDLNMQESTVIVASSDMTHYESQQQAQKKDKEAIEAILELNEDKLMDRIRRQNISMCGYAPTVIMLAASKLLGAKSAKLIKYQTSGDVTGDTGRVVGYAGIIVY